MNCFEINIMSGQQYIYYFNSVEFPDQTFVSQWRLNQIIYDLEMLSITQKKNNSNEPMTEKILHYY